MGDSKKILTSFEQEFNRLSFLASIATGSTPPEQPAANVTTQPDPGGSSVSTTNILARAVDISQITSSFTEAKFPNGYHVMVTPTIQPSIANQLQNVPTSTNTLQFQQNQINKIDILQTSNSPSPKPNKVVVDLTKSSHQMSSLLPKPRGKPRQIQPANMKLQPQIQPASNIQYSSPQLIQTSVGSKVTISSQPSLSNIGRGTSISTVKVPAKPIKPPIISASISSSLNQPLILSNATVSNMTYAQTTTVSTTSQAILLPANFAGMSGKVVILNQPSGKNSQIAITPTAGNLCIQPQQALQQLQNPQQTQLSIQSASNQKPVILLPHSSPQKINIPKDQKNIVDNALQMLQKVNTSPAVKQQILPQLQNVQGVNSNSFQAIKPKSLAKIKPKVSKKQEKKSNILTNQNQGQQILKNIQPHPQQNVVFSNTSLPNNHSGLNIKNKTLVTPKVSSLSVSPKIITTQNITILSNNPKTIPISNSTFIDDQTLTKNLLTLQKTDPHLFIQNPGEKLRLNFGLSSVRSSLGDISISQTNTISNSNVTNVSSSVTNSNTVTASQPLGIDQVDNDDDKIDFLRCTEYSTESKTSDLQQVQSNILGNQQTQGTLQETQNAQKEKLIQSVQQQQNLQQQQQSSSSSQQQQQLQQQMLQIQQKHQQKQEQLQQQLLQKQQQQQQQQQNVQQQLQLLQQQQIQMELQKQKQSQQQQQQQQQVQLKLQEQQKQQQIQNQQQQTQSQVNTSQQQLQFLQIQQPVVSQQQTTEQEQKKNQNILQSNISQQILKQNLLRQQILQQQQQQQQQQQKNSSGPINSQTLTLPQAQQAALQKLIFTQQLQQAILQQKQQLKIQQILQQQQQQKSQQAQNLVNAAVREQILQQVQKAQSQLKIQSQLAIAANKGNITQQSASNTSSIYKPIQTSVAPQNTPSKLLSSVATNQSASQTQLTNAPLKLLSSLTNSVAPTSTLTQAVVSTQTLSTFLNTSTGNQAVQPIIIQLPNGQNVISTQMIQSNQITPAQLLEFKNSLQPKLNAELDAKKQKTSVAVTIPTSLSLTNPAKPQQSIIKQTSAFSLNQTQTTTSILSTNLKTNDSIVTGKNLQTQLKNLTPVQRDVLAKQLQLGKVTPAQLQAAGIPSSFVLSSLLKTKQVATTAPPSTSFSIMQTINSNIGSVSSSRKTIVQKILPKMKRPAELAPLEIENPLVKRWKSLLQNDQEKFLKPIITTPFIHYQDACKRLLAYHIVKDVEEKRDYNKFDELFETFAENIIERKQELLANANVAVLKEGEIKYCKADEILCERLRFYGEKELFEQQKKAVLQGRAFVVKNEESDELECVEIELKQEEEQESSKSIHLSDQKQLDTRLCIAHKDIRNVKLSDESGDEDNEDNNDDNGDNNGNGGSIDELEMEEIDEDDGDTTLNYGGDISLEDDTNNILNNEEIIVEETENTMEIADTENMLLENNDFKEDNELAAATTNLLADLQQDDDYLEFML